MNDEGFEGKSLEQLVGLAAESADEVRDLYSGPETGSVAFLNAIALVKQFAAQGLQAPLGTSELSSAAAKMVTACLDAPDDRSKLAALAARWATLAAADALLVRQLERIDACPKVVDGETVARSVRLSLKLAHQASDCDRD